MNNLYYLTTRSNDPLFEIENYLSNANYNVGVEDALKQLLRDFVDNINEANYFKNPLLNFIDLTLNHISSLQTPEVEHTEFAEVPIDISDLTQFNEFYDCYMKYINAFRKNNSSRQVSDFVILIGAI